MAELDQYLAKRFEGTLDDALQLQKLFKKLRHQFDEIEKFMSNLNDCEAHIKARAKFASAYLDAKYALVDPALAKYPDLAK